MRDAGAIQPVRRGACQLLLEERRLVDAVGPSLTGGGPARDTREHHLGDADVVVEHLGLGGTRRRIQHLVRVGQLDPADLFHHLTVLPVVSWSHDAIRCGVPGSGRRCSVRRVSAALADPADLVPYGSGDQTPMDNNCREMPSQVFTHSDSGSGANPDVPVGTDPGVQPAT